MALLPDSKVLAEYLILPVVENSPDVISYKEYYQSIGDTKTIDEWRKRSINDFTEFTSNVKNDVESDFELLTEKIKELTTETTKLPVYMATSITTMASNIPLMFSGGAAAAAMGVELGVDMFLKVSKFKSLIESIKNIVIKIINNINKLFINKNNNNNKTNVADLISIIKDMSKEINSNGGKFELDNSLSEMESQLNNATDSLKDIEGDLNKLDSKNEADKHVLEDLEKMDIDDLRLDNIKDSFGDMDEMFIEKIIELFNKLYNPTTEADYKSPFNTWHGKLF